MTKIRNFGYCIPWISALGVFILMMQVGIQIGWVSPNIARLTHNNSAIPLNMDQASWLASIASLTSLLGAFLSSLSVELWGSYTTTIICFVFISVSWICMILATSVLWLYVARAIGGMTQSSCYICFSLYLGEIADPRIRGTLIAIAAGGSPFGTVLGTIAETYLPMKVSSAVYLSQCVLGLIVFAWLRDSPYYLVKKGELSRARESVIFYHASSNVEDKMKEIEDYIQAHAGQNFRDKLRNLNSPVVRKALFLIISIFALPHLSGMMNISSYMEIILKKAKSFLIDPQEFVIYANITSVISTLLTFKLIDKLGRKFLYIASSIGTTISMAGLGLHFYLLQQEFDAENLQWVPVACIAGFLISYSAGFAVVPSAVLSEIFTHNVKSVAALISTVSSSFASFAVTKAYQPMVDLIGETYVFWIHAVLGFVATPFALILLPETKKKSFQEIQDSLMKKKNQSI